MSRFLLALRCFFAVLLYYRLPPQAVALLPPPPLEPPSLPPVEKEPEAVPAKAAPAPVATPKVAPASTPRVEAKAVPAVEPSPVVKAEAAAPADSAATVRRGGVQLLSILQREGRLLDFLMEEIDGYSDGQIGAAVRDIHRGCRKALNEHLKVRPIRPEPDEAVVRVPEGYDPSQIRLVGRVVGRPPFEGTLRHHGWRAADINLSDIPAGHDPTVICPAEVELGA